MFSSEIDPELTQIIKAWPDLPAFISPNVLDILVKKFNISSVGNVDEDLAEMLGSTEISAGR